MCKIDEPNFKQSQSVVAADDSMGYLLRFCVARKTFILASRATEGALEWYDNYVCDRCQIGRGLLLVFVSCAMIVSTFRFLMARKLAGMPAGTEWHNQVA